VSAGQTKTILIVEDNPHNLRLFREILLAGGHRVVESTDGVDVVGIAERERPDLILMDIRLPNISGLDITRELKKLDHLRDIPVLAVTASALKGDEQRLLDGGCDGFIAKPIILPAFLAKVDEFLNRARKAEAPDRAGASEASR
jgi:two-component system cell cycle response regulator DivK